MSTDPYNRILHNAEEGRGVVLTPTEVAALAGNDFVRTRAAAIDDDRASWYSEEMQANLELYRREKEAAADLTNDEPTGPSGP